MTNQNLFNKNYNLNLEILKEWCEKNDLKVFIKPKIENFVLLNNIFIDKNLSCKHKFFILMHESGHYLNIKNNLEKFSKNKVYNDLLVLLNEVYAWDQGFNLCKQLNINFEEEDFSYYKNKYLLTYIETIKNG